MHRVMEYNLEKKANLELFLLGADDRENDNHTLVRESVKFSRIGCKRYASFGK